MKSYGVGAERIDLIPKQILDFFDYVEGTWVVPEKDIFTIEGINRRGWFYLGSCLTTGDSLDLKIGFGLGTIGMCIL